MKGRGSIASNANSTAALSNTPGGKITGFPFFLTAYDPSDLPGGSLDPLGFERGYLFLADKILPGLTNVASRPRYFALLCAGIQLSGDHGSRSEREQILHRQESMLRLERFWALANVLARPDKSGGVRGVSYALEYGK